MHPSMKNDVVKGLKMRGLQPRIASHNALINILFLRWVPLLRFPSFLFEINTKMTNELNVYQDKKKGKAFE